ncbi:pentatricopeptide repeat-containing protein [Trifolium pratense]|uniref:Pentatricopeptide repeat-containing protein n=1 Tax=Trifolium pratense TaxID=57577 RepID=A0A2K3MT29_TRIPR|nr:pentatricopeptide repeat-containing protein [Trifolium pratense]
MGRGEGKAALEVFNKFQVFQCVPNHDTYYFTLQALLNTSCSPDMIHQAASICQNMLLLFPHDQHDGGSSHDQEYTQPPLSPDDSHSDFQIALTFLGGIPRPYLEGCVCANLNLMDFSPLRQQLHHFVLKTIETSRQTKLIETRKVSPHNLIHFIKWAWQRSNNNKDLITTPVLESLVSAICDGSMDTYDVHLRKNNILFLWDLLKHIGHCHTGLLNTRILNQLLHSFGFMFDQGKTALEVFHKFEVFQCVPNQDTYTFTLQALLSTRLDMPHQAASICQKMLLHPETLLPDDGELLGNILSWFSRNNMTEEAYALYLAANEKRKTNPNWSPQLNMLLPLDMIRVLCSKKETVHLAFEMLNDIPKELADEEDLFLKQRLCMHVAEALCGFKELEAAKQLILKPIADSQHPSMYVVTTIITAYVKAGEIRQVLEMVKLLESIGFDICEPLMFGFGRSNGMLQIRKILEEARKKDYKLITALLYHTLIVGCCRLQKFDDALKFLTQMKDFGVSHINLDEYHKLFHSLCLKAMDRKMAIEQLEEMEPMDREMVDNQLSKMAAVDLDMMKEQLEEMYLNIRALF